MSLDAELVLLGTGLLEPPTRQHVRAIRGLEQEIRDALRAALDREELGRELLVPDRPTYHQRLFKLKPDYAASEALLGPELGPEYQILHTRARGIMLDRRPVTEYQTLLGPRTVENSFDQDAQYAREVETVENHLRLAKDLAAGVPTPMCVAVFAGIFPEVYAMQCFEVRDVLTEKAAKDPEWIPPQWMDNAIRNLLRIPFDVAVDLTGPADRPEVGAASEPKPNGKLKLKPDRVQTPGQSIIATPEPNR